MTLVIRRNLAVTVTAGGTNPLKMRVQTTGLKLATAGTLSLVGQGGVTPYAFTMISGALPTVATINASVSGATLTVNSVANGALAIGQVIAGASIPYGTTILSGSGTSWTLSASLGTIASETMTTSPPLSAAGVANFVTGSLPSVAGQFTFTAQIQDSTTPTPQAYIATFNAQVAHLLQPNTTTIPDDDTGYGGAYQLTVTGATGTVTYSATTPSGITLSSAGLYSYTPAVAAGTYSFPVTASDSGTGDSITFTLTQVIWPFLSGSASTTTNALTAVIGTGAQINAPPEMQLTGFKPPYRYVYRSGQNIPGFVTSISPSGIVTLGNLQFAALTAAPTTSGSNYVFNVTNSYAYITGQTVTLTDGTNSYTGPVGTVNFNQLIVPQTGAGVTVVGTVTSIASGNVVKVPLPAVFVIKIDVFDSIGHAAFRNLCVRLVNPSNVLQPQQASVSVGAAGAYQFNFVGLGATNDGTTCTVTDNAGLLSLLGDGSDGAAVLNGTNTYSWATLAGSVYILNRDVYLSSCSFSGTAVLNLGGYRCYCNGNFDLSNAITQAVTNSGTVGGTGGTGATGGAAGTAAPLISANTVGAGGAGAAGGAGGTAAGNPGGSGNSISLGMGGNNQAGAAGGLGSSGAGAAGSASAAITTIITPKVPLHPFQKATNFIGGGCGGAGGGGAGGNTTHQGGGGGGGGSGGAPVYLFVYTLTTNGSTAAGAIASNGGGGGGGGSAGAGNTNAGGGGGGNGGSGGGVFMGFFIRSGAAVTNLVQANGGTGGTGGNGLGTGVAGAGGTGGDSGQITVFNFLSGTTSNAARGAAGTVGGAGGGAGGLGGAGGAGGVSQVTI